MKFEEIIKKHTEIYFDNKDDLEEFLDLCAENNIKWSNGCKANVWKDVYERYRYYGKYLTLKINFDNVCYLTQGNGKVDFTYNDFKKLLKPFDFIEFLSNTAVNVRDEKQFNYMYNLLKDNNVPFDYNWKGHYDSFKEESCIYYGKDEEGTMVSSTKYKTEYISLQDFISIYNFDNIFNKEVEELTVTSLKQDIEKYLIKDREATTEFNNLLDFIINVNNKYNLKLNI